MNRPDTRSERLTIDVNIARDFLESTRSGHADAVVLFRLARDGLVELAFAPQGYALDVIGELSDRLRAILEIENTREAPQIAYASEVTFPSEDLFPGAYVQGFSEAWRTVASTWHTHQGKVPQDQDRLHVETHVHAERDVFLTSDKSLIKMCDRLRDEHGIPISASSLAEYLSTRRNRPRTVGGSST